MTRKNDEPYKKNIQEILRTLPERDINISMGDFNGKIGSDNYGYELVMGRHGEGEEMTDNGERFAELCAFNDLVIGGSLFPHKKIHKLTWIDL